MAPTNADLSLAVSDVLTAARRLRALAGEATDEQRAVLMAGFPWPRRTLELRELTAWAGVTVTGLQALSCTAVTLELVRLAG